ncbi:MAG: GntR family transcriptional regulator, partial [Massilia sp.]|nr:GntR family transcriptional regulator [Massilia sp.]
APLFILAGLFTRAAALVVAINMIVAVLLVHTSQLFTLNETGGWALELQGMYFFSAVAIALLGAGRYSVGGVNGRYN